MYKRQGRAGHQHHAIGAADGIEQYRLLIGFITQGFDSERRRGRVQNPHDDLLTLQGWQGAHPEVYGAVLRKNQFHPAILRDPLFSDVQT